MAHTLSLSDRMRGYTLLELLIVVMCLAIVCMLVIPAAGGCGGRLSSAGSRLVADVEYARMASIGRGEDPCAVVFSLAGDGYHLARLSDTATPIPHPVMGAEYRVRFDHDAPRLYRGVSHESVGLGSDGVLAFDASGALGPGPDVVITLRCGTETVRVRVLAGTGDVEVQ